MAGDPVAWRAIERGWTVYDADGAAIGRVDQVTGDLNGDIFDGITVGDGGAVLTRARYVPAEQVASISEGEVVLRLGAAEVSALEPYAEPVARPLASLLPEDERSPGDESPADAAARLRAGSNGVLRAGMLLRMLLGRR